jgi:hypothetical protein
MEEQARTLDLRPLLAVAAAVAVALTLWASGAFAAGGSSLQGGSSGGAPSQQVQQEEQAPPKEDCPKDRGGGAPQGDSDGSDAPSL